MGWLTAPQSTLFSVSGARTMYLSLGERPVNWPVFTTSEPVSASNPSPRRSACSYSSAAPGFQNSAPRSRKPCRAKSKRLGEFPAVCMAKPVENQLQFIMVNMGFRRGLARAVLCLAATCSLFAQIIEFESGGLKYQTLTKSGVTVMVASLPAHVRDYAILQVAV